MDDHAARHLRPPSSRSRRLGPRHAQRHARGYAQLGIDRSRREIARRDGDHRRGPRAGAVRRRSEAVDRHAVSSQEMARGEATSRVSRLAIALALLAAACGSGGSSGPSSGMLEEAGSMAESASSAFWLNSGGEFFFTSGFGRTFEGELPADDRWRQAYARSSSVDTDGGAHPQNLFRLINRQTFRNFTQETTF